MWGMMITNKEDNLLYPKDSSLRVWHLKLSHYSTVKEERVPSSLVVLCSAINSPQDKLNMG
jgi:hypothetical protein